MRTALALFLFVTATALGQAVGTPTIDVRHIGASGLQVRLSGVPIVRETAVSLHAPGWKQTFYASNNAWPRRTVGEDRKSVTLHHRPEHLKAELEETAAAIAEDRVEFTLSGTLATDADVRVEWTLGYCNAFPLYGSVEDDKGHRAMLVAKAPREEGSATLLHGASVLTFENRLGLVRWTAEDSGEVKLSVADGQIGKHAWSADVASYWVGVPDLKLPVGKPFSYKVTLQFEPKSLTPGPEKVAVDVGGRSVPAVFVPEQGPPLVVPKPKKLEPGLGGFAVNAKTRIVLADDGAEAAAISLRREAAERFGWEWGVVSPQVVGPDHNVIALVPAKKPMPIEGYEIDVTLGIAAIRANSPAGFLYAAQTLGQLMRPGSDGVRISCCHLSDEPAMAFRGVHLFAGRDQSPAFRQLAQRVISRFKFNHVVIQCDRSEWDATPNLRGNRYVPKAQLAEWVLAARDSALEPIPLVNTLGHMDWLFRGDKQYLELAEDPDHPWVYIADDPKTYALVDRIYDEATAIFEPRFVHIGHDEVTERGKYPNREQSKQIGATKLFVDDVSHWVDHFKAKPARVMLWGDMMLAPGEAADAANAPDAEQAGQRRQQVPKDAIVCDWHYRPVAPTDYTSLKRFKDAGFTTIACSYNDAWNVQTLCEAARTFGAWGILQTTWEESGFTDQVLARAGKDWAAWVLAAEYAWSGQTTPPDQLLYRPEEVFARAFGRPREPTQTLSGVTFDLSTAMNRKLESVGLAALPLDQPMAGVQFQSAGAVVLAGVLASAEKPLPREVRLNLGKQKAAWVAFLHTTVAPADPAEVVGRYEVSYEDGSKAVIPLRYGFEIRSAGDQGPCLAALTAWTDRAAGAAPAAVRVIRWLNPKPEKVITAVTLSSEHPYASPALLGLTLLAKPPN